MKFTEMLSNIYYTCTVKVCVVALLYPFTVAYYTIRFYGHKYGALEWITLHVNNYIYQTYIMAVLDVTLCTLI
jgi:hypothetical protein